MAASSRSSFDFVRLGQHLSQQRFKLEVLGEGLDLGLLIWISIAIDRSQVFPTLVTSFADPDEL